MSLEVCIGHTAFTRWFGLISTRQLQDTRRQQNERRRNILYLIAQYLSDFGFHAAYDTFFKEANLTSSYRVCDNVDLDTIYLDYCSHYHLKFDKSPRIIKKVDAADAEKRVRPSTRRTGRKEKSDSHSTPKHGASGAVISNADALSSAISVSSVRNGNGDEGCDEASKFDMPRSLGDFLCDHPDHRDIAEILHR